MWTQQEAIDLCIKLESIAPKYGYHVALTGGCLYKDGPRKDLDIVFYDIRNSKSKFLPLLDFQKALYTELGILCNLKRGFINKATLSSKPIDFIFPGFGGVYDNA